MLVKVAILVTVSLFNELHDIIVTYHNVQILIEDLFYLVEAHHSPLFLIKQGKHVHSFIFFPSSIKPFFMNHVKGIMKHKCLFVPMQCRNFILNLFAIHFSKPKIPQYGSQLFPGYLPLLLTVIEFECILDLILLPITKKATISSDSLLEIDALLDLLAFFFILFILISDSLYM